MCVRNSGMGERQNNCQVTLLEHHSLCFQGLSSRWPTFHRFYKTFNALKGAYQNSKDFQYVDRGLSKLKGFQCIERGLSKLKDFQGLCKSQQFITAVSLYKVMMDFLYSSLPRFMVDWMLQPTSFLPSFHAKFVHICLLELFSTPYEV